MGPPDPILGLNDAFNKDTDPKKVSQISYVIKQKLSNAYRSFLMLLSKN